MRRRASRQVLAWLLVAALLVGGCGASSTKRSSTRSAQPPQPPVGRRYSAPLRATLLRTCEAAANGVAAAAARCTCTLHYLEAHASQSALEATEKAIVKGEAKEPDWMLNAVTACQGT